MLGLLTNVTLRNPGAAAEVVAAPDLVPALLRAIEASVGPEASGKPRAAVAARQGCMAIRNMAARRDSAHALSGWAGGWVCPLLLHPHEQA